MTKFKIKQDKPKGRPKMNYKVRSVKGITPKGFEPVGKTKQIKFRRKKKE